jgi:hypothetical protein
MSVRFSTSFRERLPFQIRDIFCQYTYLSHLYRNVAKVPKYSMRVRNLPDHLCPGYDWWRASYISPFSFHMDLLYSCVFHGMALLGM